MEFTHFNSEGHAKMVDVQSKTPTERTARAKATVKVSVTTLKEVIEGRTKKGDVLAVSQVAGIMAAKKTSELIPMCHDIALEGVDISFEIDEKRSEIIVIAAVKALAKTGVEMEALQAVTSAALTIYDMCKALQRDIVITDIKVIEKRGGTHDFQL